MRSERTLSELAARMAGAGASLTLETPGAPAVSIGADPGRTRVVFRTPGAVAALLRGDHLALAEAYLRQEIDVTGELRDALRVTEMLDLDRRSRLTEALVALRFLLDRRRLDRESVAAHYDRPPEFFLAWLERTRSYTHGFYAADDEDATTAQERKLDFAIDALGLAPGMHVFDMGCGWGAFLEHAGRRGIHVHGITLSRDQHDFVAARIRDQALPCELEYVDFLDYRPARSFDGAVFMGSLEHMPDYRHLARFLATHLKPGARAYADFVSTRDGRIAGAFLRKYIFPGISGYVDPARLARALERRGLQVGALADDTHSCALTVRDWARTLEQRRAELAALYGEATVRAFLLYLWSSYRFLATGRTQAYHLVVARPAGNEPGRA